jgi:hypothetical protein
MSSECDRLDTYDDDDNSGCESEVQRPSSSASMFADTLDSTSYHNDSTTYHNEMGLLNLSFYIEFKAFPLALHIMANI